MFNSSRFALYTTNAIRRKIHAVTLGNAVKVQEFIELLQRRVSTQVRHRMVVVDTLIDFLQRVPGEP